MGIFGRWTQPGDGPEKTPIGPIDDAQIAHARRLMALFNRAVGDDASLRAVSAQIFATAGVRRIEDLLQRSQDTDIGWRWLAAVSWAAASQDDTRLVSEIFAFTWFWNDQIAPLLRPGDWEDLCLPRTPDEVQAQIAADALPRLLTFPPNHVVMGNSTGELTAGHMAFAAAQTILDLDGVDPSITPEVLSIARNVVEAPALPASSSTGGPHRPVENLDERSSHGSAVRADNPILDDLVRPAVQQLDRVKGALTSIGLRYVDLGRGLWGVGLGIGWSDTDYIVLSVAGGLEGVLNLTAGVLKDVAQDRLAVLNFCNSLTQNNAAFPFFLHDAPVGWDVLAQQRHPIDVLLTNQSFFRSCVENLPTVAKEGRVKFIEAGIQGQPYGWNDEDRYRLLVRSVA